MKDWHNSCLALLVSALVAALPGIAAADGFFQAIDDLPIASGLTELADQGVAFDSPGGRIVTAIAQSADGGEAGVAAVEAFYGRALPPLGWSAVSARIYTREGERLTLQIERTGNRTILRVRLVPERAD